MRMEKAEAFPSENDLDKCGEWLLMALYTMKICGVYAGNIPPNTVKNYELRQSEASFLYFRHLYARTQVLSGTPIVRTP